MNHLEALPDRLDVVVTGAGPAGCITAMLLAQSGCSVVLFDSPRSSEFCIGETLPPQASGLLRKLGLMEAFLAGGHREARGIVSLWGSAEPMAQDFLFSPYGNGWHLDRSEFNKMLAQAAACAGATVVRARVVEHDEQTVTVLADDITRTLQCSLIVDAAGRSGGAGVGQPARRVVDHLIGAAAVIPAATSCAASDYTLIEAMHDGWFYSALLPSGAYVVALMTDADLYSAGSRHSPNFFTDRLACAPHTRQRLALDDPKLSVFCARSSVRNVAAGEGWLAVGDAARSFDPLSGLGILTAIRMATEAAPVALKMLGGDASAARHYSEANESAFHAYLNSRGAYYRHETRWLASDFWARRS